jgi:hypothetical protein
LRGGFEGLGSGFCDRRVGSQSDLVTQGRREPPVELCLIVRRPQVKCAPCGRPARIHGVEAD